MLKSRVYRKGKVTEVDFPLEQLGKISKDRNAVFWLDLIEPTPDELHHLSETLDLHELAVEDAFKGMQRPKIDHYDSHLFINLYHATYNGKAKELNTVEMSVFVTKRGIVTIRSTGEFDMHAVTKRWDESSELSDGGVDYLLWGLLDVVVDSYFDVIQELDMELEELESLMFEVQRNNRIIQQRSYALRKALVLLRRVAIPMREVLNPLVRRETKFLGEHMAPYFQDVYDHIMRVGDWTDSLRDLVTTLLETNLTIQGNQMNLIMKKVTSWAAIIAVPTAITGFYGQNLPYPGFDSQTGFITSSVLIVLISGILYWVFKRRDWL
jgi:magnesium transporter